VTENDRIERERPTRVGIALVGRRGRYLVRQRPSGTAMAGYWEFPGGKCEPDESPAAAAARECLEETGLDVTVGRLRRVITHRYPHAWVELSYYDCETRSSEAEPGPDTGFQWIRAEQLGRLRFPGANEPILEELGAEHAQRATRLLDPS
jgi:8-oxo-dGTP diphosphatase